MGIFTELELARQERYLRTHYGKEQVRDGNDLVTLLRRRGVEARYFGDYANVLLVREKSYLLPVAFLERPRPVAYFDSFIEFVISDI